MYKDIEFICSGNNDRSPVAHATATRVLADLGLSNSIAISSSGVDADFSKIQDLGTFIAPHVKKNVDSGLLPQDYILMAQTNPQLVLDKMIAIGANWRNKYISENLGLDFSTHQRQQTIIRPEAQLILAVDPKVHEKAQKIYSGVPNVRIELLPEYVGLAHNLSGNDTALTSYEDYRRFMENVNACAREAIHKAIGK